MEGGGYAYERWATAVEVGEVVVMVADEEMARVFSAVAVRVAN